MTKMLRPSDSDIGQQDVSQKSQMAWISCCSLGALWGAPFIAMPHWSLSTQALRSILSLVFTAILVTMPARSVRTHVAAILPVELSLLGRRDNLLDLRHRP